jgi:hypothetical protein
LSDGPRAPYGQPPGWYADPYGEDALRWWDGGRWAEETRRPPREAPRPARGGPNDWAAGPGSQTLVRRESPQSRRTRYTEEPGTRIEAPVTRGENSLTRAENSLTRAEHSLTRADNSLTRADTYRGERPPVGGNPSAEADEAAEEMRRSGLSRLAFSALFALSLILFAAGFALHNDVLRLLALTGALFFGIGTAPLQLSESAALNLRLCVAGLVGLSVPLLVASVMVLEPSWHPSVMAVLFGATAVWVHVIGCRRALSGPLGAGILRSVRLPGRGSLDASVACSMGGTLLWLAGMATTRHVGAPGVLGFLPDAPVYWYLGLVLLVAGIVLSRGKDELRAAFGAVSLLAALTVTPSVVYGMPRSQSAAKHIDLVQNILQAHSISSAAGIYKAYSGFFSAIAWLCDVSAMHNVTGIATYFPFFIDLIALAGLRVLFGRLTASRYRIWVAITLVILVNSIGADYFSPQAVGFSMGVGVFGLALDRDFPGLSERGRMGILLLAGCAMAVTHELSPYIVGGALVVLVVFRVIRPWYVPLLILVPAGIWAFINRGDLSGFISLSDFGNLSNFAPPPQAHAVGLERLPIVKESSYALALGLLILIVVAGVALVRNIKSKPSWAFMVSTGVGLALVAVNPYGNEGIFRAALFAIPWLASVSTQVITATRKRFASIAYGVIGVVLLGTYLVSMFGLDNTDVIRPADFQALITYQDTASPYSYMLGLSYGDNLPVSVDFPQGANHFVTWGTLITQAEAEDTKPSVQDADAIAQQYFKYAKDNDGETRQLYAVYSPASAEYDVDYGLQTISVAEAWRSALSASPDWKVVYSSDGSYLFRVAPSVSVPAKNVKKAKVKNTGAQKANTKKASKT